MTSFPLPPSTLRPANAPRVAVIGGGISGLAAAHRLIELLPNAQLSLFEASGCLGGILDTVEREGFLIERSADNFLTKIPAAVDLCRQLGIANELLPTDESRRRALVVKGGRLVPVPAGFYLMSPRQLWPLLKSPILSIAGKLRVLVEPFVPQWNPSFFGRGEGEGEGDSSDESVASFASRRMGRETFERIVQPLVAGMYTADSAKLSMAATLPEFLAYERDHGSLLLSTLNRGSASDAASGARYGLFLAPKHGITSIVKALADRLPPNSINLNTPVSKITRSTDGAWQLDFATPQEKLRSPLGPPPSAFRPPPSYDYLILAVPSYAAARLLEQCDADLAAALAEIVYAGVVVVSMGFAREQIGHSMDSFGFVVPQIENRRIIAGSFASQKFPGRAPNGSVLIRAFVGGALRPELLDLSDNELRRLALEELSTLMQIKGEPILVDIARWPRAMPQYHVGHLARVARIEELAKRHTNLALAGNAYRGVGIPQCIASGQAAAQQVVEFLSAAHSGSPTLDRGDKF